MLHVLNSIPNQEVEHSYSCCLANILSQIKITVFWYMTSCSLVDKHERFWATCFQQDLKVEASYSSETLVSTYQTTRRHVPDDRNLNIYSWEDCKFNLIMEFEVTGLNFDGIECVCRLCSLSWKWRQDWLSCVWRVVSRLPIEGPVSAAHFSCLE
jgi:hypothetical protein